MISADILKEVFHDFLLVDHSRTLIEEGGDPVLAWQVRRAIRDQGYDLENDLDRDVVQDIHDHHGGWEAPTYL